MPSHARGLPHRVDRGANPLFLELDQVDVFRVPERARRRTSHTCAVLLPSIRGVIKRRVLVNYRVDPEVAGRLLPNGLKPKLQGNHAIAGICLIRLEEIRPPLVPRSLGFSGENVAHRIAVLWRDLEGRDREGVFIPIRHTESRAVLLLGGRLFPGIHKRARFDITDDEGVVDISIASESHDMRVALRGNRTAELPSSSAFASLQTASEFFRGGSVGYSPGREPGHLEGLKLVTPTWRMEPLAISDVYSSWIDNQDRFPRGSVDFDCALLMRDVAHSWQSAPPMYADGASAEIE